MLISEKAEQKVTREENLESASEYTDVYSTIRKQDVVQEAKCFHSKQIDENKCIEILAKIIYLANHGETFAEHETTDLFFGVTKLFQSRNKELRRLIYLFIKEMKVKETEVFIVVSSLTKDMNSTEYSFKANSMKVLAKIIDPENLPSIERYLKQAIMDKHPYVQKGALMSGIILHQKAPENIKKWSNEVQDKLGSTDPQILYLSLMLLSLIKSNDLFSASRIIQMVAKKDLRKTPLAHCQLIREMKRLLLSGELDPKTQEVFMGYLDTCLSAANSDMVVIEACKAICEVAPDSISHLESAYALLQSMIGSPKSIVKYSALKILKKIAPIQLDLVAQCGPDLEKLVTHANKSVASMAISILLKICKEKEIEPLLATICQYLPDMADEFRVDAIQSVKHLIKRYPSIHKLLVIFLRKCLRIYSNIEFKREIIDSVTYMIQTVPQSREEALNVVVDLIEDCQFDSLISKGLEIMANEIPKLDKGEPFIRFICNRLILEGEKVRASAVTALAKLGRKKTQLQSTIKNILMKCLVERADEVRDRAALYLHALNLDEEKRQPVSDLVFGENHVDVSALESFLMNNKETLTTADKPLQIDLSSLKHEETKEEQRKMRIEEEEMEETKARVEAIFEGFVGKERHLEAFKKSSVYENFGDPVFIAPKTTLTDSSGEYEVSVAKYMYSGYIALQFEIRNLLSDVIIKDVSVSLSVKDTPLQLVNEVKAGSISHNETAYCYTILTYDKEEYAFPIATFKAKMAFTVVEIDPASKAEQGSYPDEYSLPDVVLSAKDYVRGKSLGVEEFKVRWDILGKKQGLVEKSQNYQIGYKSLPEAAAALSRFFGLTAASGTEKVDLGATIHQMMLAGEVPGRGEVMAMVKVKMDQKYGCVLSLHVRTTDEEVCNMIMESLS